VGDKGERTGWGSLDKEACERHTNEKRNEREGGSGTGMRVKIESRQVCRGKRGVQCEGARQVRRQATAMRAQHTWAPPPTAFLVALLSLLFPFESRLHKPSYTLRSGLMGLFQNPAISVANMRALLYQPIVDFPLEHQDIFIKENVYRKGGSAV
jgi:hypothetical protein